MKKENGAEGINLSEFRLYYKVTGIMIIWYWYKNRNIAQSNKIESPEINHTPMGTLPLTKEANIYSGEKIAFSINGTGKTGWLHVK